MAKIHVNSEGESKQCHAEKGGCPYGAERHFDNEKDAQAFAAQEMEEKYGDTGSVSKSSSKNSEVPDPSKNFDEYQQRTYEMVKKAEESGDVQTADKLRSEVAAQKAKADGRTVEVHESGPDVDLSEPDSGGTWSPTRKTSPTSGFCYSPYPQYSKCFDNHKEAEAPGAMEAYCDEHRDMLDKDDHYVGMWNDPETGKVYFDISVVSQDSAAARKECQDNDQIAFFDLQSFESVTVNQNAKSGQA